MRTLLAAAVAVVLVACSGGVAVEGEAGAESATGGAPYVAPEHDAGAKKPACDPLVPHADASPDGC